MSTSDALLRSYIFIAMGCFTPFLHSYGFETLECNVDLGFESLQNVASALVKQLELRIFEKK